MPPRAVRSRAAAPAKPAATALTSEQQHEHSRETDDGAESAADARAYSAFKSKVDEHVSRLDTEVDRRIKCSLVPLGERQDEAMYHKMKAQFLRLPKQVRKMLFVVLRDKFGGDMAAAAAGRAVVAAREAPQETEAVATAAAAAAASLPAAPAAPRPPPLPPSLRAAAAAAFAASPSNPRPPRKRVMIAEPLEGEEEREEGGGGNGSSPSSPPLPPLKRQAPDDTAPFEPKREPAAGEVVFSANGSPLARFEDGGVLQTAAKGGMGLGTTRRAFANPVAMRDNNEATTFTILRPPGGGGGGGAGGLTRSGLAPGIEFALPSGKRVVIDVENSNFDDAGLTSKEAREVENYLQGLSRLANVALRSRKGRGGGGGSRR